MYIASHWNFEAESDPTHGLVTYQSQDQAKAKGLASVKDGVMVLSVDTSPTLPTNGKRDSWVDFSFDTICHFDSVAVPFNRVRISSKQKWGQGLFIADFAYMPHGCGVWPAYWSVNSETWPNGGEIDILEGVNNQLGNQYTLHTGTSCALPSDGKNLDATSNLISYDCQTYPTDNRGCAFLSPDAHSYGAGLTLQAEVWLLMSGTATMSEFGNFPVTRYPTISRLRHLTRLRGVYQPLNGPPSIVTLRKRLSSIL